MSLDFIFLVSFLEFNFGFIKFILEIYISFQELCISNTDYKAVVPGSNPANASIPSVRDGHGGGWSRKINAWHLYTLMVYL